MNSSTLRGFVLCVAAMTLLVTARSNGQGRSWWNAGSGERLPALSAYPNASGALGVLNTSGAVDTKGHPFFEALGSNGRANRIGPASLGRCAGTAKIWETQSHSD